MFSFASTLLLNCMQDEFYSIIQPYLIFKCASIKLVGSNTCISHVAFVHQNYMNFFPKQPQSWKPSVDTHRSLSLSLLLSPPEISCFQRIVWFDSLCVDLRGACVFPTSSPLHDPPAAHEPLQTSRERRGPTNKLKTPTQQLQLPEAHTLGFH